MSADEPSELVNDKTDWSPVFNAVGLGILILLGGGLGAIASSRITNKQNSYDKIIDEANRNTLRVAIDDDTFLKCVQDRGISFTESLSILNDIEDSKLRGAFGLAMQKCVQGEAAPALQGFFDANIPEAGYNDQFDKKIVYIINSQDQDFRDSLSVLLLNICRDIPVKMDGSSLAPALQ
jgi:hypothetical protein